jgi:hypothetical protein
MRTSALTGVERSGWRSFTPASDGTHVFLLGAGATIGARSGNPVWRRPPSGGELGGYVLDWIGRERRDLASLVRGDVGGHLCVASIIEDDAVQALDLFARIASVERDHRRRRQTDDKRAPFEAVLRALFGDQNEAFHHVDKRPMLRTLANAFIGGRESAFAPGPDLYDDLVSCATRGALTPVFITLNYDCLLEEAILRLGGAPAFGESVRDSQFLDGRRRVEVRKPHGSATWASHHLASGPQTPPLSLYAQRSSRAVGALSFERGDLAYHAYTRTNAALEFDHDQALEPLMVLFIDGKAASDGARVLEQQQSEAMEFVRAAERLTIIGVNFENARPSAGDAEPFLSDVFRFLRERDASYRAEYVDIHQSVALAEIGVTRASDDLATFIRAISS